MQYMCICMYVHIWYVYIMHVWYDKEAMSLWRLGRTWREQEDEDGNTIILKYESLNDEWVGKWKASGSSCPPLRTEFLETRRGGYQPMACISTLEGSPGTACLPFCTSWRHLGTHGAQTPGPRNWKAALLSQHLSSIQTNCCFPRLGAMSSLPCEVCIRLHTGFTGKAYDGSPRTKSQT